MLALRLAVFTTLLTGGASLMAHASGLGAEPGTDRKDPIARLEARIQSGEVVLARDSKFGYLKSLLNALNIPASSQGFVFSRTSLQTDKITPWTPRALYFNDDVYIGFVQGSAFLEIGAVDPEKGGVFYTFSQTARDKPAFTRETSTCLMCHASRSATGGVPGFMVLSTIADRHGYPIVAAHEGATTDATPLRQRFGGYYVTGSAGPRGHSGNVFAPVSGYDVFDKEAYRGRFDLTTDSERLDLAGRFETAPYLSPSSDIVALMVLVHQTWVHNLITATREAAVEAQNSAASSGDPSAATLQKVNGAVDRLLRAMLFVDEAPLPAPVKGNTAFVADFEARGARDSRGRSLRDFDLKTRLFRYPMSFLVYSESFDALPPVARRAFYERLDAILRGEDNDAAFRRIPAEDRRAISEILEATKPDFKAMRGR